MDAGMYELVEKIWQGVGFIAIGGAVALLFFFVFAPSILGSKTIHRQLKDLSRQIGEVNEQLKQIVSHLKKARDNGGKET
jgi:hypothetical protein